MRALADEVDPELGRQHLKVIKKLPTPDKDMELLDISALLSSSLKRRCWDERRLACGLMLKKRSPSSPYVRYSSQSFVNPASVR